MRVSANSIALSGAVALAIANLGRLPVGVLAGRNAPVTVADFIAALAWFALVLALLTGRARPVIDGVISAAAVFALVAMLSTMLAVDRYRLGVDDAFEVSAFLARWILYFGWYPFVAWCLTDAEATDACRYVQNALLAICAFGIIQALFIPEFGSRIAESGLTPAWEYQGRRLVSTLLDPNFAGGMAVLALLPGLALVTEGARVPAAALILPTAAIVLTASRSSVLALVAGVATLVLARGIRARLLRVIAAGGVLLIPLLPLVIQYGSSLNKFSVDRSAAQRLVTWKRGFTLFVEHPWLGIGFNASKQAQEARGWSFIGGADTGFDGGLLFVMVMTGVIGAACYAFLLGRGLLASRRAWRDSSLSAEARAHASGVAAATIAILVHSLFSNTLLLPFVMMVLWIRFGRLAHISAERRRRLGLAAAVPIVLAVSACSPCAGVASCNTTYVLSVNGSIRSHVDGSPVPGARIDVDFSGAEGVRKISTLTDVEGLWSVRVAGSCCDDVSASVVVSAPGQLPFVVPSFRVRATNKAGDAKLLEPWLDRPSTRFGMILVGAGGIPLQNAAASFQRIAGVPASPFGDNGVVDGGGIFHVEMLSDRVGDVIGTLTVNHPSLSRQWRRDGIVVPMEYRYRFPKVISIEITDASGLMPIVVAATR